MTKEQSYVDIFLFRTRDQSHSFSTICTWAVEIGKKNYLVLTEVRNGSIVIPFLSFVR